MSSPALKVMLLGRPYNPQDTMHVASRDLAQSVGSWRKCWLVEVVCGLGRSRAPNPTVHEHRSDGPGRCLRTALSIILALSRSGAASGN